MRFELVAEILIFVRVRIENFERHIGSSTIEQKRGLEKRDSIWKYEKAARDGTALENTS